MSHVSKKCDACDTSNPAAANYCCRCGESFGGPHGPEKPQAIRSTTRVCPILERWRRLSHRLTRSEVRKLLGEPARIDMPQPPAPVTTETWLYEYESTLNSAKRVTGTVTISIVESRLMAWQEPDWNRLGAYD